MNSWLGSLLNRALAGGQRPRLLSRKMCLPTQENGRQNPISGGTGTYFCLLRSPDQVTEHVVVVVVVHGTTFLYWKLLTCERSFSDKMLDIDKLSKCEKFQPSVTMQYLCQKLPKRFNDFFSNFAFFAFWTFKITSKFKFDLICPT